MGACLVLPRRQTGQRMAGSTLSAHAPPHEPGATACEHAPTWHVNCIISTTEIEEALDMRGSRWAWEPPGRAQRAQLRQQLQHLMQVPISSLTVHHSSNTTTSDLLDSEATAAAPPESLATAQASLRSLQLQMGWWSMDKGAEALCERESVLGQCQQPEAGLQQVLEEELDQDASSRGSRKTNEKRGAQGLLCSAPASLLAQPTCSKSDPEEEGQAPARAPSLRLRQSSPHSCGLAKQPASVGTLVDAKAGAQAEALQQQQVQMQVQAWVAPVTQVPAEQVAAQVQVGKAEGEGEAVQQPGACRGAEDATAGFRYSLEDSARERLIHFMQLPAPRHAAALPKHKLRFFSASNALEAIPEAHAAVGQPGSDAEGRAQLNRGWSAVRPVPLPQQQQRRRPNRSLARRASAPTDATLHRMMQWFQSVGTPSKQPEAFHDVFHFLGNADEGEGGGDGAEKAPAGEPGGLKASAHPSGGTPASGHCPQQQQQQVWEAQEAQPNSLGANDLAPLSISSSRREHHGACSVVAVGRPRILGPSAPGCILKSRRFCSQCTNVAHGSAGRVSKCPACRQRLQGPVQTQAAALRIRAPEAEQAADDLAATFGGCPAGASSASTSAPDSPVIVRGIRLQQPMPRGAHTHTHGAAVRRPASCLSLVGEPDGEGGGGPGRLGSCSGTAAGAAAAVHMLRSMAAQLATHPRRPCSQSPPTSSPASASHVHPDPGSVRVYQPSLLSRGSGLHSSRCGEDVEDDGLLDRDSQGGYFV